MKFSDFDSTKIRRICKATNIDIKALDQPPPPLDGKAIDKIAAPAMYGTTATKAEESHPKNNNKTTQTTKETNEKNEYRALHQ